RQVGDDRAALAAQALGLGHLGGEVLDGRADVAAGDLAAGDELAGDVVGDFGGNREADADRAAGRGEDGRVDPDHPAVDVEGPTARVAPVDGRVDLDVVDEHFIQVATVGRDDAGGGRAAQAERVADGDHPVADPRLRGVLEVHVGIVVPLDLQNGEVGALVAADHGRLQLALVLEDDGDLLGVLDHVVVGDDVAVGADEEARARGLLPGQARLALGRRALLLFLALAAGHDVEGEVLETGDTA